MNRLGLDKRLIFSGAQQKKRDLFVAHESRSKITMDRRKIIEAHIRHNKLDVTLNDKIMKCKAELDKLRILNKLS